MTDKSQSNGRASEQQWSAKPPRVPRGKPDMEKVNRRAHMLALALIALVLLYWLINR